MELGKAITPASLKKIQSGANTPVRPLDLNKKAKQTPDQVMGQAAEKLRVGTKR